MEIKVVRKGLNRGSPGRKRRFKKSGFIQING